MKETSQKYGGSWLFIYVVSVAPNMRPNGAYEDHWIPNGTTNYLKDIFPL